MEFSLILAIAAAIGIVSMLSSSQLAATWRTAARSLGVDYQKKNALSSPRINGVIDGKQLTIEVRGSGNSRATRYRVRYPSLDLGLQVTRTTGMSRLSEFLGAQDAETGDRSFDEEFTVKTTEPDRLETVLTPPVRQAIRDLLGALPAAKITDAYVVFDRRAIERKLDRIVGTAQRLLAAAAVLARSEPSMRAGTHYDDMKDDEQRVGSHYDEPEYDDQRVESHYDEPLPPDPYSPWGSIEVSPTPLPPEEPVFNLDDAEAIAPEEILDSATGEFVFVDSEAAALEPQPVTGEPLVSQPAEAGPGPLEMAEALFGGRLLSFDMTALFDQQYAGQQIRWPGTVSGRKDSGTEVNVGTLDTDLYGLLIVRAIVADSRFQEGDAVVVGGTLAGIDPYERTVTVDGSLSRA